MFHLMVFRGLRRGEAVGLSMGRDRPDAGTVHISEQLVASSDDVWEDMPKSESSERTIKLDSETRKLLEVWRERQDQERADWELHAKTGSARAWCSPGRTEAPTTRSTCRRCSSRLVKRVGLPPVGLEFGGAVDETDASSGHGVAAAGGTAPRSRR
ncbi:hypothetical protein E4K10_14660 [Streptomyces sp. T1317-0309]|nr:hypothetical protein E4K10_14660 [Streptomyces sp. T1317-0309]